jgi:hypothetical protein
MIKFFRKIRQGLLTENKFNKYLIYAIGEIALVMIGILLALQVNNWNEEKKQLQITNSYLKNLHSDFKQNEDMMNSVFESLEGNKRAMRSLANFIDNGFIAYNGANRFLKPLTEEYLTENITTNRNRFIPIIDTLSLVYNLNRAGFLINYDLLLPTWDEIISSGNVRLIENKDLKKGIKNMKFWVSEIQEIESNLVTPVIREFQKKRANYFDTSKFSNFLSEEGLTDGEAFIDINGLRTDKEFSLLLQRLYRSSNEQRDNLKGLKYESSDKIIEIIDNELIEITK